MENPDALLKIRDIIIPHKPHAVTRQINRV